MLSHPTWRSSCREKLDEWISQGAGRRLPVVFDFDNSLICGDIGEATLAWLIHQQKIPVQPRVFPALNVRGTVVSVNKPADLATYYEALLDPTVHGAKDPTPLASGYVWAIEVMRALPLPEVVAATEQVWALSQPGQHPRIEITPGGVSYPVPFLYPEMIELLAELIRNDYEPWIFSASNAWSVRWVVMRILNPALTSHGAAKGIPPDRVIGITTLLLDPDGQLLKDAVLVRDNPAYAALEPEALKSFRLSAFLQFPVPTYSGKVGLIWDAIRSRPYLGVGDSPGDLPMLSFCEHRLWVNRPGKHAYRRAMIERSQAEPDAWLEHDVQVPPSGRAIP